jgi:hypothetical protein
MIDNQVLSYRLLDGRTDPEYDFLFEDPRLVLQIGRQVINETLNSVGVDDRGIEVNRRGRPVRVGPETYRPGLPIALHQRMWEGQAELQSREKLVLVGQMLPAQRIVFNRLAPLIETACSRGMGPKDARVVADALVRRIPLYSGDVNARHSFSRGVLDPTLSAELRASGLATFATTMFVP